MASEDSDLGDGGDFESFSGKFFKFLFYIGIVIWEMVETLKTEKTLEAFKATF